MAYLHQNPHELAVALKACDVERSPALRGGVVVPDIAHPLLHVCLRLVIIASDE